MTLPVVRGAFLGAAAVALIGTAAACSSGTTAGPAAPPAVSPAVSPAVASDTAAPGDHEAFAKCLSDNGVAAPPHGHPNGPPPTGAAGPPPDGPPPGAHRGDGGPPPAPPGVDQGTWDKAMAACSSLAPHPPPRS